MASIKETKEELVQGGYITEEESELVGIMAKYKLETNRNNISDEEFVKKYNLTWDKLNAAKVLNNQINYESNC